MLALSSYGLPAARRASTSDGRSVLPPLVLGNIGGASAMLRSPVPPPRMVDPRDIQSLTKWELQSRRKLQHPLYRTTTSEAFTGARTEDSADERTSMPLLPRHPRIAGFTKEFIAGTYQDTSLISIDKSQQRAEAWQRKMEARTTRMQHKYAQLQLELARKKEQRRGEREIRRRETEALQRAAVCIQAQARGFLARVHLQAERRATCEQAAAQIQQVFRSRERVKQAKAALEARRRARLDGFAIKLQHAGQRYILRQQGKQELARRRQQRDAHDDLERDARCRNSNSLDTQQAAAISIQRVMRGHIVRRANREHSARSVSSSSASLEWKDEQDQTCPLSSRPNSQRGRQRLVSRTMDMLKARKRERRGSRRH